MGLKFRRGTTAQKSGSLAFGEPYVNTDLGTLQIGGATGDITLGASGTGSAATFAGISGSSLDITGNAKIDGNLTLGGQLTIGDATSDTVNVVASLSSSLIPQTTNVFDLGSASKIWRDLYISTGSIKFVAGTTVVATLDLAKLSALEAATGSANTSITNLNSFTSSIDTTIKTKMNTDGVVSGSSQVIGILSSLNTYTGSNDTTNTTQTGRLDQLSTASGSAITRLTALEVETSNLESFTSSINTTIKSKLDADGVISGSAQLTTTFDSRYLNTGADSVVSGSSQIDLTSTTNYASGILTRLQAVGVFSGSSQVQLGSATGNIALATQTTGDYVASLVASTGVTITNNSGENATPSIAIGQAVATSSNVQFNSLGIGMVASATAGRIDATNDIVAYSSSDIRFKENIQPIENALEKISKISGNTYDWKAENKIEHGYEGNDVGVIAQEIEAVLPQLVQTRENGYKAVKYDKLVALLIEGIKEQQTQIHTLTLEVEELKKQKGL